MVEYLTPEESQILASINDIISKKAMEVRLMEQGRQAFFAELVKNHNLDATKRYQIDPKGALIEAKMPPAVPASRGEEVKKNEAKDTGKASVSKARKAGKKDQVGDSSS